MIDVWVACALVVFAFAAGCGVGHWRGQGSDWARVEALLKHGLATQTLSNAQMALENEASVQANVAQELKDKRTAAYFASKRRQEPTSREDKRAYRLADQAVNGHD